MCRVCPGQVLNIEVVANFYPFLGMGPVARITLSHQLVDVSVHLVPEDLATQLSDHHLLPKVGFLGYTQYISSFKFGNQHF